VASVIIQRSSRPRPAERREAKLRVRSLGGSEGVPEAVKKAISQVQASIGAQMTPNV
jgi:hypothetical protein